MYFRNRMYDPKLGRFISRDPKGVWGDAGQLGNGQSAFGSNPFNRVDPFGRDDDEYDWIHKELKGIVDEAASELGLGSGKEPIDLVRHFLKGASVDQVHSITDKHEAKVFGAGHDNAHTRACSHTGSPKGSVDIFVNISPESKIGSDYIKERKAAGKPLTGAARDAYKTRVKKTLLHEAAHGSQFLRPVEGTSNDDERALKDHQELLDWFDRWINIHTEYDSKTNSLVPVDGGTACSLTEAGLTISDIFGVKAKLVDLIEGYKERLGRK